MQFEFVKYNVESELDFVEDNTEKINTLLTVYYRVSSSEDPHNIIPLLQQQLTIINLNSQRGDEMDQQREQECINYVNSLNN